MFESQQIPDGSSTALPRVLHTPRSRALLSESWAQADEAKRRERAGDDLQLPHEAYAAGEPCRACGRALLGEPALGTDEEGLALIDADNAQFRAEHAALFEYQARVMVGSRLVAQGSLAIAMQDFELDHGS